MLAHGRGVKHYKYLCLKPVHRIDRFERDFRRCKGIADFRETTSNDAVSHETAELFTLRPSRYLDGGFLMPTIVKRFQREALG